MRLRKICKIHVCEIPLMCIKNRVKTGNGSYISAIPPKISLNLVIKNAIFKYT